MLATGLYLQANQHKALLTGYNFTGILAQSLLIQITVQCKRRVQGRIAVQYKVLSIYRQIGAKSYQFRLMVYQHNHSVGLQAQQQLLSGLSSQQYSTSTRPVSQAYQQNQSARKLKLYQPSQYSIKLMTISMFHHLFSCGAPTRERSREQLTKLKVLTSV